MNELTIITPCSRPDNLSALAASIEPGRKLFDLTWRIVFDGARVEKVEFPGAITSIVKDFDSNVGNAQKNAALDHTMSGWVWFLDDDNLVHPDFFAGMGEAIADYPQARGFIFQQVLPGGALREVGPENMRVGRIDLAQFCLRSELIGDTRFDIGIYEADGILIQKLYWSDPAEFEFIHKPLCYYNALR